MLRYVYIMQPLSQGKVCKVAVCIVLLSVYCKESCLNLRYVYDIKCSSQGKLF